MKILDFVLIVGVVVVLLVGVFVIHYYFTNQSDVCINSPLTYGARQLESRVNADVIGSVLITNGVDLPIILYFNSTTTWNPAQAKRGDPRLDEVKIIEK